MPTVARKSRGRPRRNLAVERGSVCSCWLCDQPSELSIINRVNGYTLTLCASCWGTLGVTLTIPEST